MRGSKGALKNFGKVNIIPHLFLFFGLGLGDGGGLWTISAIVVRGVWGVRFFGGEATHYIKGSGEVCVLWFREGAKKVKGAGSLGKEGKVGKENEKERPSPGELNLKAKKREKDNF